MKIFILALGFILATAAPAMASNGDIPLSPKEEEALRLAGTWADRPIKPIQTANGKVVYVHGSTMPTVIGAPMQICDVELEPGEVINEILVGDTTRWLVESGMSGGGIAHLFIKPLDAGLQSSLVVTTNKRVYHMKLLSQPTGHMSYIGFLYQEQAMALVNQDRKQQLWSTTEKDGLDVDLSRLDFNYSVSGKAPWKPIQVYNDGRQTFLKLPDSAAKSEVPVLLAMKGKKEQLVNYRVHNNTFVVDGLFPHLALISGIGGDQQRVDIKRRLK
jgi:type IV secretion system protein VirB9